MSGAISSGSWVGKNNYSTNELIRGAAGTWWESRWDEWVVGGRGRTSAGLKCEGGVGEKGGRMEEEQFIN